MNDEFDDLLETALTTYSKAEPLNGLDERVLARVRAEGVKPRIPVGWCFASIGLALLVLIWLGARHEGATVAPVRIAALVRKPIPIAAPKLVTARAVRHERVRRPKIRARRLSPEEVLLVRFVETDPEGAVKEFASLHELTKQDLRVPPLVVEPITIKSLDEEEK